MKKQSVLSRLMGYKDAPIILIDEATASLDVENETIIQTALSRLIKDKTVLIIAHRMRTVAGADKIVVLADGVVAEQGVPDELYKKNGIYTRMVDLQSAIGKRKVENKITVARSEEKTTKSPDGIFNCFFQNNVI